MGDCSTSINWAEVTDINAALYRDLGFGRMIKLGGRHRRAARLELVRMRQRLIWKHTSGLDIEMSAGEARRVLAEIVSL